MLANNDRIEIMKAIKVAFKRIYGTQKDYEKARILITAEQLSERFPCFSKEWIRKNGYLLPRERVNKWEDESCTEVWGYRWNEIQKEIHEGKYRNLKPCTKKLYITNTTHI